MRRIGRALVTGGCGFVGHHLVGTLVNAASGVVVLDNLSTGKRSRLPRGVELVEGDVRHAETVANALVGVDTVFHLACVALRPGDIAPTECFSVNGIGTAVMLEQSMRIRRGVRFVYASSVSVYGNADRLPIVETDPVRAVNPYAAGKLGGEQLALAYYERFGLDVVALRLSNVYGPGMSVDSPYCGFVGKAVHAALNGKTLRLDSPLSSREYTYAADVCEAFLAAAVTTNGIGEVFNVGGGEEVTCERVIRVVEKMSEKPIVVMDGVQDPVRRRVVSSEKARRMLRWSPRYTFADGVKRTVLNERARGAEEA